MTTNKATLSVVKLSQIEVVSNTRTFFKEDDIKELSETINQTGLLHPIGILKVSANKYRLIYGERRFRAYKLLKEENPKVNTIAANVFDELTEDEILEIQIIENLERKDIHPMEEAAAFLKLTTLKKQSIKDIAARMGKSVSFVAQRLKLNELCDEFQQAFFNNRISISDAMRVTLISKVSQKNYWESEFADLDHDDEILIENYEIKRYLNNLMNAPFDIKDKKLIPNVGSCVSCPFNTACQKLLFPEEAKTASCTKGECFSEKSSVAFSKKIAEAREEAGVELITFNSNGKPSKSTEALINEGVPLINASAIEVIDVLEEPKLEDYKQDLEDGDYDDEAEMMERYSDDLDDYKKELKDHNEYIADKIIIKGFAVDGHEKGNFVQFFHKTEEDNNNSVSYGNSNGGKLTAKVLQEKQKEGTVTEQDYKNEISRMESSEARKKELDEEKAQPLFYEAFSANKSFVELDSALIKEEKITLFLLLMDFGGWMLNDFLENLSSEIDFSDASSLQVYEFLLTKELDMIDALTHKLMRGLMMQKLKPNQTDRPSKSGIASSLLSLVAHYNADGSAKIVEDMTTLRTKREGILEDKIKAINGKVDKLTIQ